MRLYAGLLLVLCMGARAQDGLTTYGVLDVFATRLKADGLPATTRIDSSGLLASRVGVRGAHELGDGLRSNFVIEIGLNQDDGGAPDGNRLANRQAWVGLTGRYGELRLGRQNTPQFYMNGKYDAFTSATQASGWNNLFGAPPRTDNAIALISPLMAGVRVQALLARGATGGAAPALETANNQNLHFALEYERGPLYVGANHQVVKANSAVTSVRRSSMGASYAVSSRWSAFGAAGVEQRPDGTQSTRLVSLSARYQLLPATSLAFGWAGLQDRLAGPGHGDAREVSAMLRHVLSKRTSIYSALSHLSQEGQRNSFFLGGSAVVTPAAQIRSPLPGGDISGLQLGLLYSF
ncbi:MAG: porin [Pseudomonadota bacterium]